MKICRSGICRRTGLFLLPVLFSILLHGCGSAPPENDRGSNKQEETVPLNFSQKNLPFVRAQVNNHPEVPFLIYPSADRSIVFRDYALRMNLIKENGKRRKSRDIVEGSIRKISIRSVSAWSVPVRIVSRKEFSLLRERMGKQFDQFGGILGFSFFKKFEIVLNYPEKSFSIRNASLPERGEDEEMYNLKPTEERGQVRFSLTGGTQNRRYVTFEAGVNGKYQVQFAIDPALPINLISPTVVRKYGLRTMPEEEKVKRFGAGARNEDFVDMDRIWISGLVVRNSVFKVSRGMSGIVGSETAGVLGYVFLKNLRIRIHYPRRKLDIRPVK